MNTTATRRPHDRGGIAPTEEQICFHLFESLCSGLLSEYDLVTDERAATTVILASEGYPGSYEKGREIKGLDDVADIDGMVFHAGANQADANHYHRWPCRRLDGTR